MKKERRKGIKSKTDLIFYCLILAFPVAQFCVFYIGVNFNSVLLAFQNYDITTNVTTFAGFSNFELLFHDLGTRYEFIYGLRNSLLSYAVSLCVGLPTGLIFSYYIYKHGPGSALFQVVLFMPSIITQMVLVIMYQYFTDLFVPEVVHALFGANMTGWFTGSDMIIPALLVYSVFTSFGVPILMYLGAMKGIPDSVIEAAELDGVTPLQEFVHVILPQIFSTVSVFLVTGIAGIFSNQLFVFAFFGSLAEFQNYTIGYYLYVRVQQASSMSEYPYLAALGLLITVIIAPLTIIARKIFARVDPMN